MTRQKGVKEIGGACKTRGRACETRGRAYKTRGRACDELAEGRGEGRCVASQDDERRRVEERAMNVQRGGARGVVLHPKTTREAPKLV
jgi:hypothetical protein